MESKKKIRLEWTTVKRKIKDLVPYDYNPRKLNEDKKALLIKSIEKFNLAEIPAINTDNKIIAGHQRIKVLMELGRGEEEIDVRLPSRQLTDAEFKEYNITSNVPVGFWDIDILETHFEDIDLKDLGVYIQDDIVLYEEPETEAIEPEAVEDDFIVPEEIKTNIVVGDLFEIGNHRLLCGDSTDQEHVSKLMNGEYADMVMTDPPYNVDYQGGNGQKIITDKMQDEDFYKFLLAFYQAIYTFLKPGGAFYVWHADSEAVNFRKAFQDSGLLLKQCLIWVKNSLVLGRQDYHWKHEPCIYGWKPGAAHYFVDDRTHTTVIEDMIDYNKMTKKQLIEWIDRFNTTNHNTTIVHCDKPSRSSEHPTMKPILLLSPLISNSSRQNEIVADTFLGSGSTMVASEQLNRKCYGMELDPKYCQVIVDRMLKLNPLLKVLKNGQPYKKA